MVLLFCHCVVLLTRSNTLDEREVGKHQIEDLLSTIVSSRPRDYRSVSQTGSEDG